MANKLNLGKVGMTTGGQYNQSLSYEKLTCVVHNGTSWMSRMDVPPGIVPGTNVTYWQQVAERGEQGPAGQSFVGNVKIVDNLTEGGSDAVLSAEQGKVLSSVVNGTQPHPNTRVLNLNYTSGYFERIPIDEELNNYTGYIKLELYVTQNSTYKYPDSGKTIFDFGVSNVGAVENGQLGGTIVAPEGGVIYADEYNCLLAYEGHVENKQIFIRNRAAGQIKVVYYTEQPTDGLVHTVEHNRQQLIQMSDVNTRLDNIEEKLTDVRMVDEYSVDGKGTTTNTQVKVVAGITHFDSCKIVAATNIVFAGDDGESFISMHAPLGDSSAIHNEIFMLKGTVGQIIPEGTVIANLGETTFAEERSLVVGRRYSGTLKVVLDLGMSYGLETQVALNTAKLAEIQGTGADVVSTHKEQLLRARQLGYRSNYSDTVSFYPILPLAFMHMSDSHSTKPNQRAIEMLNYLGTNGHVKFLLHTGDILVDPPGSTKWSSIVAEAKYPVYVTAGNHDVGNWKQFLSQQRTDEQFYEEFVAPQISTKWSLKTDGEGTPHPAGKNYYFTDFTEEKVRLIVAYEYEIDSSDFSPNPARDGDVAARGARWISQEQTDWLIESLKTTPAGYGVILAHHAPEAFLGNDRNPFNSTFRDGRNTIQTYQQTLEGYQYRSFFADIVQAFIDRKNYVSQIKQVTEIGETRYLNINADFRSVASNTEFICHVSGHVHVDNITKIDGYPKQIELNINCSSTSESNQRSEVQLIEGTSFEDCVNVYGIDRNLGQIYVLRIGADYSSIGERKDMYTFSYR